VLDDWRLPEPSAICRQRTLIAQLDIPVREIDEVFPEVVLGRSKGDLDKRPPLWPLRFADQAHVCFTREPIAFARIAWDAGANHVFPSRRPAPVAWHDVIQIKVTPIEKFATVLAGVLVSLKHVVSGEFYFLLWKPIEHKQYDHPRDLDLERNGRNHFMIGRLRGQIAPAFEVVRRKVVRVIRRNNLGVPCVYERKGAASRTDIHRLPEPVEHQNLTVQ
jgi:hypothetical protein